MKQLYESILDIGSVNKQAQSDMKNIEKFKQIHDSFYGFFDNYEVGYPMEKGISKWNDEYYYDVQIGLIDDVDSEIRRFYEKCKKIDRRCKYSKSDDFSDHYRTITFPDFKDSKGEILTIYFAFDTNNVVFVDAIKSFFDK